MKFYQLLFASLGAFIMGNVAVAQTPADAAMAETAVVRTLSEVAPFPEAPPGYVRQVIFLSPLENEADAKVELIIGKTIEVDCNSYFFIGTIEERTLEGWGYNYYFVSELTGPAGTLMACVNNEKTERFISMNSGNLLRYNSKLPIVVYVPEDVEVRYRIWRADANSQNAAIAK